MNAPVRITKSLLKAVTTAAAHHAKNFRLSSKTTRADYAYRGLLNTNFSYADFMTHLTDIPPVAFDRLPEDQLNFITEGHDFDKEFISALYKIGLDLTSATVLVLVSDYDWSVPDASEPSETREIYACTRIEETVEKLEKIHIPSNATEETEEINTIANLPKMPKNIVAGLEEINIKTYADLAKLNLEEFIGIVRSISGGIFHINKCTIWLNIAKEFEVA
jgi:hypothetical protein